MNKTHEWYSLSDPKEATSVAEPSEFSQRWIEVATQPQMLRLYEGGYCLAQWPVSTAAAGLGQREGSFQTPTGWHCVRAKIGHALPENTWFSSRRSCGLLTPERMQIQPERDWIVGRILWLSGLQKGHNRLGACDTFKRYIYIHGTSQHAPLGVPASKGCVRMSPQDVLSLFDAVQPGTLVLIHSGGFWKPS